MRLVGCRARDLRRSRRPVPSVTFQNVRAFADRRGAYRDTRPQVATLPWHVGLNGHPDKISSWSTGCGIGNGAITPRWR